jgi:hypothetical protein
VSLGVDTFDVDPIHLELDRELTRIASAHRVIAVYLSGGLDSAAVLSRLARLIDPARIVTVCANLIDDRGRSSAIVAEQLAAVIAPGSTFIVADESMISEPAWNPAGPRLDAAPLHNDALAIAALSAGATVALTGDGGDEIFGTPRFLSSHLAGKKLLSYLGDTALYGAEAAAKEAAAAVSRVLPSKLQASLFKARAWRGLSRNPHPFLHPSRVDVVLAWGEDWCAQMDKATGSLRAWAELDAWTNAFPFVPPQEPSGIEITQPLLAPRVMIAGLKVSLSSRYDPLYKSPYWRTKSGVIRLFAEHELKILPTHKQIYTSHLARINQSTVTPKTLLEVDVISPSYSWGLDAVFDPRVVAVENWLRKACEAGYSLQ